METNVLHITSEQETEQLGERIGQTAKPGTVIALIGVFLLGARRKAE